MSIATVYSRRPQDRCCVSLRCSDTPRESFPSSPQRSLSELGWECPAGKIQIQQRLVKVICSSDILTVQYSKRSEFINFNSTWIYTVKYTITARCNVPLGWPWCCWGWLLSGCCRCCGFSPGFPPHWWGWVAHRERSWMDLLSLHLEAQSYMLQSQYSRYLPTVTGKNMIEMRKYLIKTRNKQK